jgi:hypothetical protein
VAPPAKSGGAFAGKSGRKTANACEANPTETITIAATHFISRGLIKTWQRDKKIFCAVAAMIPGR